MKRLFAIVLLVCFTAPTMSAIEQAYPKTSVGTMEIKTLPAATLIATTSDQAYFKSGNGLFMPLFRFIKSRDIAMTTPVEAEIEPGVMYFYIGGDASLETLTGTEKVTVHTFPSRQVASIGVRGSYSQQNFLQAKEQLEGWLNQQTDVVPAGPARASFWNGPMMPGFLKRFEVHIPVNSSKP